MTVPPEDTQAPHYIEVHDSAYRTWETRENHDNWYGRLLSRTEDGSYIPVICTHGGSMWLCRECARAILAAQKSTSSPEDTQALAERVEERLRLCREQIEESPFSHTVAAGWYAEDAAVLVARLNDVTENYEHLKSEYNFEGFRGDHLVYAAEWDAFNEWQRTDGAALRDAREERESLFRELATIFGPAPQRASESDNARWLHHIGAHLIEQAAALRDAREALRQARGYVEEPGRPGTVIETTEESAAQSAELLTRIDAILAASVPAAAENDLTECEFCKAGTCVLSHEPIPPEDVERAAALARERGWAGRDRVEVWTCPDCAFSFDACHTDRDGGYSCPACGELAASSALREAREALRRIADEDVNWGESNTQRLLNIRAFASSVPAAAPTEMCPKCNRDLHGYSGPLCRYCDPEAFSE